MPLTAKIKPPKTWKNLDGFTEEDLKLSAKRLEILAKFLEKLPKDKFNYTYWFSKEKKAAESEGRHRADTQCGSIGCALGWACAMPEFQELGLKLTDTSQRGWQVPGVPTRAYEPKDTKNGTSGTEAGERVFFLSKAEACFLFEPEAGAGVEYEFPWTPSWYSPDDDASAKDVAKHIRKFIAKSRSPKAIAQMKDPTSYYKFLQ